MLQKHKAVIYTDQDEKGFEVLKTAISKNIGLKCNYYRESYLRRRIKFRMNNLGIGSYWEYIKYLKKHSDECSLLLRDLTINYSKFFRDSDVFLYFQNHLLRDITAKKKLVRILSAGCASGEEPYTISIIVNEALGQRLNEFSVSIYAVDIDEECLNKAKLGEYEKRELSGTDERLIQKYFLQNGNKFKVKDDVRRFVRFKLTDLTHKLEYQNFDVIFCRNVLIYFDKQGQVQIFKNFYDALIKNGYMIIGKTELLPEEVQDMFKCLTPEMRVFQKI